MKQINPCCGIKHKTAILAIAVCDIAYGLIFECSGIASYVLIGDNEHIVKRKNRTISPLLQNYRQDRLEMVNMIIRPAVILIFGIILFFSAKYHLKKYGIRSMFGCTTWIVAQIGLFSITVVRFTRFINDKEDRFLVKKSGATVLETFVILAAVIPFMSMILTCYEIITVALFILKMKQDRQILKSTEKALQVAQANLQARIISKQELQNEIYDKDEPNLEDKPADSPTPMKSRREVKDVSMSKSQSHRPMSSSVNAGKLNTNKKTDHHVEKKKQGRTDPLFQVEVVKDSRHKLRNPPA